MGCCASTNSKLASGKKNSQIANLGAKCNRTPPPSQPLLEEETVVKEVLSETPAILPKPALLPGIKDEKKVKPSSPKIKGGDFGSNFYKKLVMNNVDSVSETSELCSSLSGSVSTAVMEKREDDSAEFRLRVGERSPAKFRNRPISGEMRRDGVVGKSPSRRSEPSPGRARLVSERERRGFDADGPTGSSRRRSRSPAMRTDVGAPGPNVGRSPSARKTGKSPGRIGSDLQEKDWNREESKWPPTTNESLENPLVSLECFIFL